MSLRVLPALKLGERPAGSGHLCVTLFPLSCLLQLRLHLQQLVTEQMLETGDALILGGQLLFQRRAALTELGFLRPQGWLQRRYKLGRPQAAPIFTHRRSES